MSDHSFHVEGKNDDTSVGRFYLLFLTSLSNTR